MTTKPVLYCDDGSEIELPFKYEICGHCQGHGTSSAYLGVFTRDDIDADPEFLEDYLDGCFDRACDVCGGSGKSVIPDFEKMTDDQQTEWLHQESENAECDAIHRQERLMEGGWRELDWY